ncbi:translation initiation factor IF-2-like [Choloepus didactylus]|uniref:translation initiation factor IF-2-like n=1 Tax=Choloepus didactylus TaxID=27675 RepID=UPI00189DC68F|nr:translation initiation factor IF-2-like [Choloepus didactylus]
MKSTLYVVKNFSEGGFEHWRVFRSMHSALRNSGNAGPALVVGRVSWGQSRFFPRGGRLETASVNAPPPQAGPGSAGGGRRNAGPGVASSSAVRQAAKRLEGGEGHTKNTVSGGERGRQIRDRNSSPRPLAPQLPGVGPRRHRQCSGAPAPRRTPRSAGLPRSSGPNLVVARLARPLPARPGPARPPPGKRAPPHSCGRGRKSVRGRRAGQLASLEKFLAPRRGGAARPSRPRSPPVTLSTRRQPGPPRGLR